MKRLLKAAVSLLLMICILTNTSITLFADTNTDSQASAFPYDNVSNYVADCINIGLVNIDGTVTSTPYISLAILHEYTYQNLTEALIDERLLTFNSTFWKNIRLTLDADFTELVNWQKNMYIALIMDYLNYSVKDDVYVSNLEKKTMEFSEEIFKKALGYANSEYLKNVDNLIEKQSLTDAVDFSHKYGYIYEINEYVTLADDIETKSASALEYYENLSKALAVKSADENRIEFLEQMKKAGSDNKYFAEAVDEVLSAYQATFSEIAFSEGYKAMSEFAVKKCFNILEDNMSELKFIFDGLNTYTSGLDWLFNSDDISDNNLKLLLLYTMGSYTLTALNSLRDTYEANPAKENAEALIGGFLAFLKYREYATSNTYGFITSTLFDGISNKIKNIFLNENQAEYEDFKNYLDYDINFSQNLEELVNKSYSIYFNITASMSDFSAETDAEEDNIYQVYQEAVQVLTSSGSWTEDLNMTANMSISKGNAKTQTKASLIANTDISNYSENDLSGIKMSGSANVSVMGQKYIYNIQYENGIAHYEYTEPNQTTADIEMDPSCFDFNSMTADMMEKAKVSGNKITFTIPGNKIEESDITALNMISGIENLNYDDIDVEVLLNKESGAVEKVNMSFHASLTYQGYDAEADYQIYYSFR